MSGTKAVELDRLAAESGLACMRLDYSGHGLSGGTFTDGTISRWLEEALAVILHVGPDRSHSGRILDGRMDRAASRAGACQAARRRAEARRHGADRTGTGLHRPTSSNRTSARKSRSSLAERGFFEERSAYSPEPNIYTRSLLEDGRENRVLTGIIETGCPVHILQGMKDPDVPYQHAMKLVEHLPADDVVLTFVRDGDHRLSRPQDIERMLQAVKGLDSLTQARTAADAKT